MKVIAYFFVIALLLFIGLCGLTFFAPASTWVVPELEIRVSDLEGGELPNCVVTAQGPKGFAKDLTCSMVNSNNFRIDPVKVFRSQGFGNPTFRMRVQVQCEGYHAFEYDVCVGSSQAFGDSPPRYVLEVSLAKKESSSNSEGKLQWLHPWGGAIDLTDCAPVSDRFFPWFIENTEIIVGRLRLTPVTC
jgi:hypothetical protein